MSIRHKRLPIAALERIDDRCAEFERRLQAQESLPIESCLGEDLETAEREVLLAELVALEVDYRRRRGESPDQSEYLERFPEHREPILAAFHENQTHPSRGFEPPTVERLGELFPSLNILELIGAGGMGAVYKARQEGLDRVVAIKILPEEFAHDVKFALRFTREARTLAKLNHPNIVSVYEFGNVDETYYFLMEYVEGSSLREVTSHQQLDPAQSLEIVPHLCDALQYAHDKGVVHRDIKPENILLRVDGTVKIADFGLSRILDESQPFALTATHQVMGTPRYMAPEQLEGAKGVDHRADIYSLGVVIYEMLTGELPIGRFAAPSKRARIDVRLDEVVLRTLEKEPQLRYQRASEIKSDVQTIASTDAPQPAVTEPVRIVDRVAPSPTASLHEQDLAGRLLLTRRELMSRVANSMKPLFRGQLLQIVFGLLIIVIGAQCWAQNIQVPHRLVCGIITHVYGILMIAQAANVCTRISRLDYTQSIDEIRDKLESVRSGYLRAGVLVGFVWWLMWIPLAVAIGFDAVMYPGCLYVSLVIGVIGMLGSVLLYYRALTSDQATADKWTRQFSGSSLNSASLLLDEIEQAGIQ
ncbi:MAG: serine/threonine-protein kinase [Planctomycetota bacterium]